MIAVNHPQLTIRRQCDLLGVNRNRLKATKTVTNEVHRMMKDLNLIYLAAPSFSQRNFLREVSKLGWKVDDKQVRRLMQIMGVEALVPKLSLSTPAPDHKISPLRSA